MIQNSLPKKVRLKIFIRFSQSSENPSYRKTAILTNATSDQSVMIAFWHFARFKKRSELCLSSI